MLEILRVLLFALACYVLLRILRDGRRPLLMLALVLGLAALPVGLAGGCSAANPRQQLGLSIGLEAVRAAEATFVSWDAQRQAAAVDAADSPEHGATALVAHRRKRDLVAIAFAGSFLLLSPSSPDAIELRLRLADNDAAADAALAARFAADAGP